VILDWFVRHKRFGKFRNALHRRPPPLLPLSSFPRTVHLYWDQGFDNAPELVRLCVQSWEKQNPGWTIRSWDGPAAEELVSRSGLPPGLKITPYSDILRTEILKRHGGVWADATVYCRRPLDDWLLQIMCQTDFFAFSRPGPDREIASWFLAARAGSAVVEALSRAVARFWSRQKAPTRVYHWFQYIFEYLDRTSAAFRHEWQKAPRIGAAPMLLLQEKLAGGVIPGADEVEILRAMPMHKLTHKREFDLEQLKRVLGGG
jgi:capsular polysaccharide synthesis protein